MAAAKERSKNSTDWRKSGTDPSEEKETVLESLSYHWECAKSYFLLRSDGGDGQSTNQRLAVVDESLSSDSGHSSPLSLLLIITLMNEAITTSLIVPSSSLTQPEEVGDSATVRIVPSLVPRQLEEDR